MTVLPPMSSEQVAMYEAEIQFWRDFDRERMTIEQAAPRVRISRRLIDGLAALDGDYGHVDLLNRKAEFRDDRGQHFVYRVDGIDSRTGDVLLAWPD